jgi:formamidopyrimidine-DNA glycosylase
MRQQEDQPEGGAARPARGGGARQYLCLRGAVSFASVAAKIGRDAGGQKGQPTDHAGRLVSAIHAVLNQAIKAGGSSLRDHRQTSGELGYFQHSFQVYDREGEKCQTAGCGGIVRRFTQNGRSTFWCPKCQK